MAKKGRPPARGREVRTRSKRPTADNPEETERALSRTLASLGLYAAHTTGDGNCLFRALADQYYGDPKLHVKVRSDVCDYLEVHAAYFQNYVLDCDNDDLAAHFAAHIAGMRQLGTYGDDMEVTAFSKMTGCEIRVVLPGLVYVVADHSPAALAKKVRHSTSATPAIIVDPPPSSGGLSARERRRLAREAKGKAREGALPVEPDDVPVSAPDHSFSNHTLWIVYHSYEHYSSARNVSGPHVGLPLTEPRPNADVVSDSTPSLTDDSDDATSDTSPSADERLFMQSLPSLSPYGSVSAARALIARHEGSWELALEAALAVHNGERKRSASPELPEGSSPRQRIREESASDSSDDTEDDGPPPPPPPPPPHVRAETDALRRPLKDRGAPTGDRLTPPLSRETRAQARERHRKEQSRRTMRARNTASTNHGSDVSVAEGIRTLRV